MSPATSTGPEQGPTGGGGPPAALGIDLGGTKVLGVVLDAHGEVLAERRLPTPTGPSSVVAAVVEVTLALEAAVARDAPTTGGPLPLGVGVPGLVEAGGVLRAAPHLPGVRDLAVGDRVRAALVDARGRQRASQTVVVENDATGAVVGEVALGAARGVEEVLLVTFGTGLGGGLVSGGRLVRGRHGLAGEFGHMVVDPEGLACPCGRRGCWEQYASGGGLVRLARGAAAAGSLHRALELAGGDPDRLRGEHVSVAAAAGDADALGVLDALARWIGLGLANLATALDPEVIVVGGGLIGAGDLLLEPVRTHLGEMIMGAGHRPVPRVVAAGLGERAGAVGAALMAARAVQAAGVPGVVVPSDRGPGLPLGGLAGDRGQPDPGPAGPLRSR
ncbi:MAG TPA: ROK family protein [Acidimicrobiales bacterium]|nr:ROK family protein [Acidimicrobiales bacterium]